MSTPDRRFGRGIGALAIYVSTLANKVYGRLKPTVATCLPKKRTIVTLHSCRAAFRNAGLQVLKGVLLDRATCSHVKALLLKRVFLCVHVKA
jgi:hypothetical protein